MNQPPPRILVVEEDADTRANLCGILKVDGYDVRQIGSFAEAMSLPGCGDVAAFVLDWQLIEGVADDRISRLLSVCPNAAIIIVTGYSDLDSAIACLRQGADDYLLKPINPDALRISLARAIELRRARQEMRETSDRLRAVYNSVVDAIVTIDCRGIIVDLNPATLRIFGYSEVELKGQNVKILMPSPYRQEHDGYLANYLSTGEAKIIGIGREAVARRKDGTLFPVDLAVSEFADKTGPMFTGIIRDISERKATERHMVESRLDEQQRIAQELHDGVGGLMTGIGLLAKTVQTTLERAGSPHARLAGELLGHIRDAHDQLRQVSHGLVPVDVAPEGLCEGLRKLAARCSTQGLVCQFENEKPVEVRDRMTATQLFFIAQEAVSNAVRHGKPSKVTVRLTAENRRGTLLIADDGCGFQGNPDGIEGMGLRTIKYRAALIGASVAVHSAKGNGTVVACRFPSEAPNG